jgi:hypothetical protein
MASNKSWLEGPSAKERAVSKMWQGGPLFLIGTIGTVGTHYLLGIVWIWTVLAGLAGLFWFMTGLITYYTGVE